MISWYGVIPKEKSKKILPLLSTNKHKINKELHLKPKANNSQKALIINKWLKVNKITHKYKESKTKTMLSNKNKSNTHF